MRWIHRPSTRGAPHLPSTTINICCFCDRELDSFFQTIDRSVFEPLLLCCVVISLTEEMSVASTAASVVVTTPVNGVNSEPCKIDDSVVIGSNVDAEQIRMLEEECILVNGQDKVTGHASKKVCHLMKNIKQGLLHRAFSVFLFNSKGMYQLDTNPPPPPPPPS